MVGLAQAWRWFAQEDHRHPTLRRHFAELVESLPPEAVILSVGGGPGRPHPRLLNLNIALMPNVDIVGDAHALPVPDGTVGAIYCEAVLEHLERPAAAVAEMRRVLRPGGRVLAITPFLQAFHGYPSHFQNYTIEGHRLLFTAAGFHVLDAGPAIGPCYVMTSLISTSFAHFLPRPLGLVARAAWWAPSRLLRLADRWLVRHPGATALCSATYVLAESKG